MSKGSWDDYVDVIETLEKSGDCYVLMVQREDGNFTTVWGNAEFFEDTEGVSGLDTMDAAWRKYKEQKESEEDAES